MAAKNIHELLHDTMNDIGEEAHVIASLVDEAFYLTTANRTAVRKAATTMLARLDEYERLLTPGSLAATPRT